jgi:hypothetical protein
LEALVTDTKREITRRLSVLVGLDVSAVSHAAEMLTMHFGPQNQYTTRRGTVLEGGAWALHIQCNWRIERAGIVVATQALLAGATDTVNRGAHWLNKLLVTDGPMIVKSVAATDSGELQLSMSNNFCMIVIPQNLPDNEDWRFFDPRANSKHFVIEGGKIDPWCLS